MCGNRGVKEANAQYKQTPEGVIENENFKTNKTSETEPCSGKLKWKNIYDNQCNKLSSDR